MPEQTPQQGSGGRRGGRARGSPAAAGQRAYSDFVSSLVPDPANPPDTQLLFGYLGASDQDGYTRLYLDPELQSSVDVPDGDILHTVDAPADQGPLGGTYVWIRRDAELLHGKPGPDRIRASFLEGQIRQDFAAQAQAAARTTPVPTPPITAQFTLGHATCAPFLCLPSHLGQATCAPAMCVHPTTTVLPSVGLPCPTQIGQATCAPLFCVQTLPAQCYPITQPNQSCPPCLPPSPPNMSCAFVPCGPPSIQVLCPPQTLMSCGIVPCGPPSIQVLCPPQTLMSCGIVACGPPSIQVLCPPVSMAAACVNPQSLACGNPQSLACGVGPGPGPVTG